MSVHVSVSSVLSVWEVSIVVPRGVSGRVMLVGGDAP